MFTKKTTLIIPTKDRSAKLIKLLKKIINLKIKFNEIMVIDSSNQKNRDNIIKFLKKKKIKFISTFPSTTHQRNIGLRKRKKNSKYVLFLDDDIRLNTKSFKEMNDAIIKYKNQKDICSFAFNLKTNSKNFKFEKIKTSKFLKLFGLYDNIPGKVMKSGWHTKISNLKRDTFVEWIYTGATIYKTKIIKGRLLKDLNKGFNYLEDLYFSYRFTKKKFKHIVIAKAEVFNNNIVPRNDFKFGYIEIINRFKFVDNYKLSKYKFYFTSIIRSIFLMTNLLSFNIKIIFRFFGNIFGIISCLYLEIKNI